MASMSWLHTFRIYQRGNPLVASVLGWIATRCNLTTTPSCGPDAKQAEAIVTCWCALPCLVAVTEGVAGREAVWLDHCAGGDLMGGRGRQPSHWPSEARRPRPMVA